MGSSLKIELNRTAVRDQLLKSSEMKSICEEYAQEIASRCGSGYEADTYNAPTRVIAGVSTATPDAIRDNLKNNTLLKVMGG